MYLPSHDPRSTPATAPSTLSVGGPSGIVVASIINPPSSPLTYASESVDPLSWLQGRENVAGRLAMVAAAVMFAAASTVVAALALPWFVLLAPALVTGALATGGLALARRGSTPASGMAVEQRILQLAVECGGRLTVTSVAAALSMSLAESDRALTELARGGHVEIGNDPASGVVVYTFPDIQAGLVPRRSS